MPINSIIEQPATSDIKAAYRPIVFVVNASRTDSQPQPPVVYCDIYVNSIFYKTQEKTQFKTLNDSNTDWQFDIQDACQEILLSTIKQNGGSSILTDTKPFATIYCKFRSSGFDTNGFITSEDTAPVQGTGTTQPTAGTGTQSNSFFVLNTVLQHEQNQNLAIHLNAYKKGTWDTDAFPLSHRQNSCRVCNETSDYFPFFYRGTSIINCIILNYTLSDGTTGTVSNCSIICPVISDIIAASSVDEGAPGTWSFDWTNATSGSEGRFVILKIDGTDLFNDAYAGPSPITGSSSLLPATGSTVTLRVPTDSVVSATLNGDAGTISGSGTGITATWTGVTGNIVIEFTTV